MYKISALVLALAATSTVYAADIVVEEKSLSTQTQALPSAKAIQSQPIADSTPSMQWQLYQQVQQLQQEVRDLRGQLEVQANVIERMKQDARSRYLDLDQRITQLKNTPTVNTDGTATIIASQPSVTVTVPTTATTDTAVVPAVPNPDDEKRAYFAAYEMFKTGGPNKAINPMRKFIQSYPQSTFTPSAYYWLGEFYLAASPADVVNAKKSFKIVVDQYPDTPKAATALLKLGSFADGDGKTQDAIKYMLALVKHFPNSEEAKAAKSYLSAQNVPIPVEKAKPKTDISKAATSDDKSKTAKPTVTKDEKAKAKTSEKAKTSP